MNNNPPPLKDYALRRGELSAYGRAIASSKRLNVLLLLVGAVLTLAMLSLLWPMQIGVAQIISLVLLSVGIAGLVAIYFYNNTHFVEPNFAMRLWLQHVCDGELEEKIMLQPNHPHYKELSFHTANLSTSLRRLSDDMDSLVESQTHNINEQKRVSELLFELAATVSSETEDEDAYSAVCQYLAHWFEPAVVSCYRVVGVEQSLTCVAQHDSEETAKKVQNINVESDYTDTINLDSIPTQITTIESHGEPAKNTIWVPFYAGNQIAGVVTVKLDPRESIHGETSRVLSTVSEQLSLLSAKQYLLEQNLQSRLNRDRNELAAEIHDSLAQSLLAMRYQTTLLSEKLLPRDDDEIYQDVLKIRGAIEEANEEIRGLIREYRTPLAERRYSDSMQAMIDQFSQSSGISVFFQSDDPQISFTPREESMLQRIIGESLNNAHKYADASMIRVYLQQDATGLRQILVEDDGIGFDSPATLEHSPGQVTDYGERIGLSLMQERALSIGAKLNIDSEPGEGTRVSLTMPPLLEPQRAQA